MNEQILSPLPSWKSFRQNVKYSAQLVGFPGGSDSKESACNAGDAGPIPGSDPLEKEMAAHSSILAWRIHGQRSLAGYSPWGAKSQT